MSNHEIINNQPITFVFYTTTTCQKHWSTTMFCIDNRCLNCTNFIREERRYTNPDSCNDNDINCLNFFFFFCSNTDKIRNGMSRYIVTIYEARRIETITAIIKIITTRCYRCDDVVRIIRKADNNNNNNDENNTSSV